MYFDSCTLTLGGAVYILGDVVTKSNYGHLKDRVDGEELNGSLYELKMQSDPMCYDVILGAAVLCRELARALPVFWLGTSDRSCHCSGSLYRHL